MPARDPSSGNAAGIPGVSVDSATLLGKDGAVKLTEIVWLLAGGLEYEGLVRWLAMWSDIDTALEQARRATGPMVAT